ncbi:MAG TPA: oligoribonuclease [Kofleriaceae bacterium]|nr:oligoribonuclease [Kofleriaceae bacterium]
MTTDRLIWMDMEMSGLDPDRERVLELATIITDKDLVVVAELPEIVVHQSDEVLAAMDDWNTKHHGASGLTERVRTSTVTEEEAEAAVIAFVDAHVPTSERPVLAGNSIHQDRRFIHRYLPKLDRRLHYRMVDVSTIKELARRWYPDVFDKRPAKRETHRALDDIRESIDELRFWREQIFLSRGP